MTIEGLIIEARARYPIGTECSNHNLKLGCKFTIQTDKFRQSGDQLLYMTSMESAYTVCYKGEWADVIGETKQINNEPVIFN